MAFDRDKVLRIAQTYVQRKRYDKAIPEYQKIVQHDPTDVRTLLKIGDLQSRMEAYKEAVVTYERVAKYYAEQGFALKAIAVYKQIREIIAKHVPFLADRYAHITPQLAALFTQLGLVSDALGAYDEMATRLQKAGRDRDAIEIFRKIVTLDPSNPLHFLRLAEALSRVRDVDGAIQQFSIAAEILVKLGRTDDALKVLERLLHHRAEARFARKAAEMYLARAQGNDGMLALAKLQICFQANPKDLETLGLLAKAFIVIGQGAKAIEVEKEMARLAHEQGKLDVLERIVTDLRLKAPDDPFVQKLARADRPRPKAAPPRPPPPRAERAEAVIDLDGSELVADEPELIVEGASKATPPPRPSTAEISERAQAAVQDAEWFRNQGLLGRAADTLRSALEEHPSAVALHETLCTVLLEMGSHREAVDEMIFLAENALDALDAEGAIGYLLSILQIIPEHERALELLADLGYDLPSEPRESVSAESTAAAITAPPAHRSAPDVQAGYVHSGEVAAIPLPAYELDELDDLDDDVVEVEALAPSEAPPPDETFSSPDLTAVTDDLDESLVPPTVAASQGFTGTESLEGALEEAEFFAARGLLEDACSVLEEQLQRSPNHPLLVERLREIEAALAAEAMGGSGPRERPEEATGQSAFPQDIAIELDVLDIIPEPRPEVPGADEQVDVEEVFAKFKEGVRAQIDESDSATHYDLGVAYQEMGLYSDAVEELEIAARDPQRECVSHSMVGAIHRSQGNQEAAIVSFTRALDAAQKTVEQELGLLYELGDTHEAVQDIEAAVGCFERLAERTPSYDDPRGSVQDRLTALAALLPDRPRARAVNDLDDFDAAFDAIMKAE